MKAIFATRFWFRRGRSSLDINPSCPPIRGSLARNRLWNLSPISSRKGRDNDHDCTAAAHLFEYQFFGEIVVSGNRPQTDRYPVYGVDSDLLFHRSVSGLTGAGRVA